MGGAAGDVVEDELEHATRNTTIAPAATQRCMARFSLLDAPGGKRAPRGFPVAQWHIGWAGGSMPPHPRPIRSRMPNLYLIQKNDNTGDEVSADFYERQGDDWVFLLGGSEVARLEIESIVSIAKAPRDLS